MVFCVRHWKMLPPELQHALVDAYQPHPDKSGRAIPTDAYRRALSQCVVFITDEDQNTAHPRIRKP